MSFVFDNDHRKSDGETGESNVCIHIADNNVPNVCNLSYET